MVPSKAHVLLIAALPAMMSPFMQAASLRSLLWTDMTSGAAAALTPPSLDCTPPRSLQDALKPFCSIPEYVSPDAKAFLSMGAAGLMPSTADLLTNKAALAATRAFFQEYSSIWSDAAATSLLQSRENATIAGVPVVFGRLKGVNSNTEPADTKLLIYLHGGAYTGGSCHYQWSTPLPTASLAGLTTLCVEYRLAPEHPFPAGLDDALAVYKGLLKQGYQSKNLVFLGDSCGGGMVAALAIQLQRQKLPLPAALGMFSPWADPDPGMGFDTYSTLIAVDPLLPSAATAAPMALGYVGGNKALFADPLVSPRRADWAKLFPHGTLPPTLIQVGLREMVLSQYVQLYHAMRQAARGTGRVMISPYDVMWHVFQTVWGLPEAQIAHKEMADFFRRALDGRTRA